MTKIPFVRTTEEMYSGSLLRSPDIFTEVLNIQFILNQIVNSDCTVWTGLCIIGKGDG